MFLVGKCIYGAKTACQLSWFVSEHHWRFDVVKFCFSFQIFKGKVPKMEIFPSHNALNFAPFPSHNASFWSSLKDLMPITFSSPRAQLEVVYFLISNESPYFLITNPKFQLQILCSFGDKTKSAKLNGIPENSFLCIFTITSSPGVHTFFASRE